MQEYALNTRESGFGLIEVLVSILVLTFGLLALAPLSAMVVNNNVLSSRITLATTFAQNQLEIYRRMPYSQIPLVGSPTMRTWIDPATLTEYTSTTSTPPSNCPGNALRRVTTIQAVGSPAAANMKMIQVVVWWGGTNNIMLHTIVSQ
jgi:Tfp pilus assembly protein PilV